ncbi:hypothetical protein JCM10449v2_003040 [Rhodotorula kratochvilovae]
MGQEERLLESEADVGDLVHFNILAPVVEILNQLIDPAYRPFFTVNIQREYAQTFVMTDTDKATGETCESDANGQARNRIVLVAVEEKKAGYVDHRRWEFDMSVEENAKRYSDQFRIERFMLTDYEDGTALGIPEIDFAKRYAILASPRCLHPAGGVEPQQYDLYGSVFERGLKHVACFLGVDALRECGILDYSKVDVPLDRRPKELEPAVQAIVTTPVVHRPPPTPEPMPALPTFWRNAPRIQPHRKVKARPML